MRGVNPQQTVLVLAVLCTATFAIVGLMNASAKVPFCTFPQLTP